MKNKKVIRIVSDLLDKLEELASDSSCSEEVERCKQLVIEAFEKSIVSGWRVCFPGEIISIPVPPLVEWGDYVKRDGNDALVRCTEGDPDCFGKVVSIRAGLGYAVAGVLLLKPVYME